MLEYIADKISKGGIGMIDAPTGSGKSLAVVGFLKVMRDPITRTKKRLVIAVRTLEQQKIFLSELNRIKEKHPDLIFSNIIGKSHVCPYFSKLSGDIDVYQLCQIKKTEQTNKTAQNILCQCTSKSQKYLNDVKEWAIKTKNNAITLEKLKSECTVCPYDVMMEEAKSADIILAVYNHVFDKNIRESLYKNLGLNPSDTYLLIDEAHNCGIAVEGINSTRLTSSDIERIQNELASLKEFLEENPDTSCNVEISHIEDIEICFQRLSKIIETDIRKAQYAANNGIEDVENILSANTILEDLKNEVQAHSWEELQKQTKGCCNKIKAIKIENSDPSEITLGKFSQFIQLIERAKKYQDQFLPVYTQNKKNHELILEIKNINPSPFIKEIMEAHSGSIMMSGTFAPIEGYNKYYFDSLKTPSRSRQPLNIPNFFPKENRKIITLSDVTSELKQRTDQNIIHHYKRAIDSFMGIDGNLAIFFPSYDLLLQYQESIERLCQSHQKQLFLESKKNEKSKEDQITEFKSLPKKGKSGILVGVCGGTWSEGVDFPGNELMGAFIVGLPYAKWGNIQIEIIRLFGMRFGRDDAKSIAYVRPAINRAMQAIGRVIRTKDDKGILILGDSRYMSIELPPWIKEEMHPITSDALDAVLSDNKG
jgi:DNA excision repair protein ERCC-2